ncbi:MAG: hypothetical protein ACKO96_42335, partial [Flammeovirgaceae bacterium]
MGKWSDWFGGSDDSSEAKFKTSQDSKDGGHRSERISTSDGGKHHYHDVVKTSTDGSQFKIFANS